MRVPAVAGRARRTAPSPRRVAGEIRRIQRQRIRAIHPDVLLLSEHLVVTPSLPIGHRVEPRDVHEVGDDDRARRHTPLPKPWATCLVGSADISRCTAALDDSFLASVKLEHHLTTQAGATFVDTSPWLCAPTGRAVQCPPVIDGVPAFKGDDTHVAAEYQVEARPARPRDVAVRGRIAVRPSAPGEGVDPRPPRRRSIRDDPGSLASDGTRGPPRRNASAEPEAAASSSRRRCPALRQPRAPGIVAGNVPSGSAACARRMSRC